MWIETTAVNVAVAVEIELVKWVLAAAAWGVVIKEETGNPETVMYDNNQRKVGPSTVPGGNGSQQNGNVHQKKITLNYTLLACVCTAFVDKRQLHTSTYALCKQVYFKEPVILNIALTRWADYLKCGQLARPNVVSYKHA